MVRLLSLGPSKAPALQIVEVEAPGSEGRRAPVRFLVARGERAGEPLQERPVLPAPGPIPAIAADDQRVLWTLLAEASEGQPASWEGRAGGGRVRAWELPDGLRERAEALLKDADVRPLAPGPEGGAWAVVPLSDPALRLVPFHRGVRGLDNFDEQTFLQLVAGYARVSEDQDALDTLGGRAAAREELASFPTGSHAVLAAFPGGRGRILRFRQALELAHIRAMPRSPTLRSLDLALVNALVLRTVLGIRDPEADEHPNVVPVASFQELIRRLDEGELQVGFVLNPPPVWEVRAVMEAREKLPPATLVLDPAPVLPGARPP